MSSDSNIRLPILLCFKCTKCGYMTTVSNIDKTYEELKKYYDMVVFRHEFRCSSKNTSTSIS
jgi:hypothetical protein